MPLRPVPAIGREPGLVVGTHGDARVEVAVERRVLLDRGQVRVQGGPADRHPVDGDRRRRDRKRSRRDDRAPTTSRTASTRGEEVALHAPGMLPGPPPAAASGGGTRPSSSSRSGRGPAGGPRPGARSAGPASSR